MDKKRYAEELKRLEVELVALQEWVKSSGAKVCIVFEGRDAAGKGGTISAITRRVSSRVFRVVALPSPTEREKTQMYLQRYVPHLPAAGEIVIFDRSWYNRAGVEPVLGFCTPEETDRFLEMVPGVERAMVDSGIQLIKYWLEVDEEEQAKRIQKRITDPRKTWKLGTLDLKNVALGWEYAAARDEMLRRTSTEWAPWHVVHTDDKQQGRLNLITHLLAQLPYEPLPTREITLPARGEKPADYEELDLTPYEIPTPF